MELKDIQNLIKFISKSDVSEVSIKMDEFEIKVKTGKEEVNSNAFSSAVFPQIQQTHTPLQQVHSETQSTSIDAIVDDESKYFVFKSPMIGTFYQKPSPDKPLFVNVGDEVKVGQTICIIEAMKLFNEIESETNGKIVKILVQDSSPVEFDQPLFLIDPS